MSPRTSSEQRRFRRPVRRSTMDDSYEKRDQGVSEDEGRSRLGKGSEWRRRSSAWMQNVRQTGSSAAKETSQETPAPSRPGHLRRITGLGRTGQNAGNTDGSPSAWRLRSEPAAQKWRQLKAGLKLLGQKQKEVRRLDHTKSAELVAELLAGGPAAMILASHFLSDEREHKRIPVLLEQLKINITDSTSKEDAGPNRNITFRIELEYGSGIMKMKWVIQRTLRDFWNLHVRYSTDVALSKFHRKKDTAARSKIPRFPRSAFPFAGEFRGFADEDDEEEEEPEDTGDAPADATPSARPNKHRRQISSMQQFRRRSSTHEAQLPGASGDDGPVNSGARRAERLAEKQRTKLEQYLGEMLKYVMFRPGSNRMCRFLELSALGIKLAVEGGFHGKEGTLVLQSGKGVDFRRAWQPHLLVQRHKPMWFLVRHSYIVCVDSPASMNIYDVFLVDGDFLVTPKRPRIRDQKNAKDIARTAGHAARHPQHHVLRVVNTERKLRLLAKNERQMLQFEESMNQMASSTIWSQHHRFDSFAPVRTKVFAQWLVDGRDYMWNVSRALDMARDVIYIHDWWLSPELYMRRPGAISHKWRLDRILKRKAEEGVKVFIIVYRNINSAIPIDSEYTKFALLDLHPNIFVQRSPNQYRQLEFFWAHHEKICIVDHSVAFCGGVDLCFGRWDTPEHRVVDDRPTGWEHADVELNADTCQMWPGKDYSNPRVQDFHDLSQPFSELYDRTKVPRMPWHDIGMQIVGQPARDLTRHYVQRWNFLLRQRKPTRPTPFLLPPPDFRPGDLEALGLEGTCTIQMLRSACDWSLGTPNHVEHSIMNAYCKLIQTSEHFVYIENQFFISSTIVEGTRIQNSIGDALVDRIVRAHEDGESWAAVIVIPLMPGFESTVDDQNGTSVRLIMQCQYRSICRGESSIFGRLKARGIDPTDYIQFYSLRAWGKIGPTKALVTEQLYIHAKVMVVDDRHAIIGSANINERSMRGDRDSEVAACVFDNDMIESVMAGQPYKVGRFPHTLRMRLMREHLGVDVDHVMDDDASDNSFDAYSQSENKTPSLRPSAASIGSEASQTPKVNEHVPQDLTTTVSGVHTFNHDADQDQQNSPFLKSFKAKTYDNRVTGTDAHKRDVEGHGIDHMKDFEATPSSRGRDTVLSNAGQEVLVSDISAAGKGSVASPAKSNSQRRKSVPSREGGGGDHLSRKASLPPMPLPRMQTAEMGLTLRSLLPPLPVSDDTDIGGPPLQQTFTRGSGDFLNPFLASMRRPMVEKDCMKDPLNMGFLRETWHAVALNNTKLFRSVFRCMPDNNVTNWTQYHAATAFSERFSHSQGLDQSSMLMQQKAGGKTGPPGHGLQRPLAAAAVAKEKHGISEKLAKFAVKKERSDAETGQMESTARDSPGSGGRTETDSSRTLNEKNEAGPSPSEVPQAHVGFDMPPNQEHLAPQDATAGQEEAPIKEDGAAADPVEEKEAGIAGEAAGPEPDVKAARRRRGTRSSGAGRWTEMLSKPDAEEMMKLVQGNLVEFPYDW